MKQKKKGAVYKTHTFFTHAVKKNQRYKPEWRQKRFKEKNKTKQKKKNFSRWNLNGWMDEYKISQSEEVTRVSPSTRETVFFLGETCNLFVFNMTSKTHWSISGYMERCGVVLKQLKHKTYWRCHKAQSVGGGTTTETRADMITVVHCTKLELTVIENRCEHRQKNCWNLRESIYNVHIIWGRRYRQSLFTRSAMMRERERKKKTACLTFKPADENREKTRERPPETNQLVKTNNEKWERTMSCGRLTVKRQLNCTTTCYILKWYT